MIFLSHAFFFCDTVLFSNSFLFSDPVLFSDSFLFGNPVLLRYASLLGSPSLIFNPALLLLPSLFGKLFFQLASYLGFLLLLANLDGDLEFFLVDFSRGILVHTLQLTGSTFKVLTVNKYACTCQYALVLFVFEVTLGGLKLSVNVSSQGVT
jgi:hypothetical protein